MREKITLEEENMSLYFAGEIEFVVLFYRANTMLFYGLRLEYVLKGSSNYISWKDRMEVVLEDNELQELIDTNIPKPPTIDGQDLQEWMKCIAKARRIILEGVQDHIVLNLHWKETPYEMCKALT